MTTKVQDINFLPLSTWFNKDAMKQRSWKEAPDAPEVQKLFKRYNKLRYVELLKLEKLWSDCLNFVDKSSGNCVMYPSIYDRNEQLRDIVKWRKEASIREIPEAKLYYEQVTALLKDDKLKSIENKYHTFSYEDYKKLEKIYEENEQIDDTTFIDLCAGKYLCTEWSKMDENGKSFGGFWAYPKESTEYKNAFTLTRELNIKKLMELPYPRRLVLRSTEIGCCNYNESVKYSKFVCDYVKTLYYIIHKLK